jgi:elongation factor 1-beta
MPPNYSSRRRGDKISVPQLRRNSYLALLQMSKVWKAISLSKVRIYRTLGEGKDLGNIVISFKIFPSEATVDLNLLKESIQKQLPKFASVHGFSEEPIAFGLSALIAHIVLPEDRSGVLDEVESYLLKIKEISQIDTIMVHRV